MTSPRTLSDQLRDAATPPARERPTIRELEKILEEPDAKVDIRPDGTVVASNEWSELLVEAADALDEAKRALEPFVKLYDIMEKRKQYHIKTSDGFLHEHFTNARAILAKRKAAPEKA